MERLGEEKVEWTEQEIAEYFGDEPLVREGLKEFEDKGIPPFIRESAKEFLEMVKGLKGKDDRCEYRHEGHCVIKLRPCMYRSSKMCPTYRNKGVHFLLSWASHELGPKALDLLTAHPFYEPIARASDKILSSGDCPEGVALAFVILHGYLFDTLEDELEELRHLKPKEGSGL